MSSTAGVDGLWRGLKALAPLGALPHLDVTVRQGCSRLGLPTRGPPFISLASRMIRKVSILETMSIRKVSIQQLKAARALIGWSQDRLAIESGVSSPTIKRLEAIDGPLGGRSATSERLITALETAGVIFIDENGEGPGVRLRKVRD